MKVFAVKIQFKSVYSANLEYFVCILLPVGHACAYII